MLLGIQKRQWFFLLLALLLPLLLNAVAIWQDIGVNTLFFENLNTLPKIFIQLLLTIMILGLLVWFILFISNKKIFQKQQQLIKFFEISLMALLVAVIFTVVTGFFIPLVWLPIFHDYLLGLPGSSFMVRWSRLLLFPSATIILFIALYLSGNNNPEINS
jgi:hypothetical protein